MTIIAENEVYGKHYEMAPDYNATPYEVPQESLRKDGFSSQHFQPDLVYETTSGENIYASPAPPQVRDIAGGFKQVFLYKSTGILIHL